MPTWWECPRSTQRCGMAIFNLRQLSAGNSPAMTAGISARADWCRRRMSSACSRGWGCPAGLGGGSCRASSGLLVFPRLARHVAARIPAQQLSPRAHQPTSVPAALIKSSCPRENRSRVTALPLGAFPHQLFSAGESHELSMNSLGSTLSQIFLSNVLTSFSSTVPASAVTFGSKFHRVITT